MINLFLKIFASIHLFLTKAYDRVLMYVYRPLFSSCGRGVHFYPTRSYFFYRTISVGNDVYIGPGAMFLASDSSITIGDKVLFGPNVSIIGGDHSFHLIGKSMADYTLQDKLPSDDQPVVIENDVWIGTGAIILKGVRIGRGAVVAAGAVVKADVPPYSISVGVPAKTLRYRWSAEEIIRHEEMLYEPAKRLPVELIHSLFIIK